jgi:putative aldouronate transport system permease protein
VVKSREDFVVDIVVYVSLVLVGLVALFPLLYVVAVSITPYEEVLQRGGFVVIPRSVTFAAYQKLLSRPDILRAVGVNLFITLGGTPINLALTALMAYPLSRKNLPGRRMLSLLVVFTLLFSGGLIPTYLVVKATGLLDTLWAMIIPTAIGSFSLLVMKSFFEASLPEELLESARIDGASEWRILFQIVLPLSLPVFLTVGLFYAVNHWNEFYQALIYVTDRNLQPLQILIRAILRSNEQIYSPEELLPTATIQMAAVVIASLPVIAIYPFIQKHFVKGVMLGSIKG